MSHRFSAVTAPLLAWYASHARSMPWREDPTPYHVWISEIMLQQTRVSAVIPYYLRFIEMLPDVAALASCDEGKLMKLWEGLGYYSRARNLKKAAKEICEKHGGVFPSDYKSIRALPGIGDYTAGAILSIAFGKPEPAVDGNVLRVFSRINGDFSDIVQKQTRDACREVLRNCMPSGFTSEYTQALMELGATVCLPNGDPLCDSCPAKDFCIAFREGLISDLPVKTPPKPRKIEERTVYFILYEDCVALRRRPEGGLLSGLWEFPNGLSDQAPETLPWEEGSFGDAKHVFSHIEWHMSSRVCRVKSSDLPAGFLWANVADLEKDFAIPAAFRAFLPPLLEELKRS